MKKRIIIWIAAFAAVFGVAAVMAQQLPAAPTAISPGDVIAHLARTVSWYRHVDAFLEATAASGDPLLHENTRRPAIKALQLSFDFARSESAILATLPRAESQSSTGVVPGSQNLNQAAQRAAERIGRVQSLISEVDAQRASARGPEIGRLAARKAELEAQLRLAVEIQKTLQNVTTFSGSAGGGMAGELAAQITQLEGLVPEARHDGSASSPATPATRAATGTGAQASVYLPESAGLLTLLTQFITLSGSDTKSSALIAETDKLMTQTERLRTPLTTEIRKAIARSEELTNDAPTESVQQLNADQHEIESLSSRFRQLSGALVPLREQQMMISSTRTNLTEMHAAATRLRSDTTRYLLLRSATLGAIIFLLLAVSAVWRRATFRYIRDARRRRQFMLLRRVVLICAVVVVLALGFISDFGSLATYAGFLTAGVAVALQNVILAVVAYFFLIGRYGVKIGDRVTISGVTGNVIDIGLVRIYLMEFTGTAGDLHPTGRIVVFSNAVLFQPSALFKQMPGTDFVWHSVTLTLDAAAPVDTARRVLTEAVDSVYEKYRPAIEAQHAALEQSVDLQMSVPKPSSRLRYSDTGLEFTAHYPAQAAHAPETDDLIMHRLLDAVAAEPSLKLAPGGSPRTSA